MRKDYDLYCISCSVTLPIDSPPGKEFCEKCWKPYRKQYCKRKYQERTFRNKLQKFYGTLKIPLIQSPYFFTEKRMVIKVRVMTRK